MTTARLYKWWNVKGDILPLKEYFIYTFPQLTTISQILAEPDLSLFLSLFLPNPLSSHTLTHLGLVLK